MKIITILVLCVLGLNLVTCENQTRLSRKKRQYSSSSSSTSSSSTPVDIYQVIQSRYDLERREAVLRYQQEVIASMQRFRQERLEAAQRFREEELRFELEQEDAIQRYNQGLTSLAEIMAMQANDAASYDDTVNYALGDEGVMSRRKRSHDEDAEEDVDIGVTNQGIYAALNLGSSSTDNNNKATSDNQRQTVWARR